MRLVGDNEAEGRPLFSSSAQAVDGFFSLPAGDANGGPIRRFELAPSRPVGEPRAKILRSIPDMSPDADKGRTPVLVPPVRKRPSGNAEVLAHLGRVHQDAETGSVIAIDLGTTRHSR